MSSMKLFNPSFSYGAKQSSFSKYEHQEHMSQSNYANYALPVYEGQAPDSVLGQPMDGFDAIESNHARGNNSNNYYAQAQRALPSPPVHVQQAGHQMGGMKKHEGYMGHEWASKSPKYSNPALVDDLGLDVDNENHMLGEMEYGWGNKPNRYSNPAQTHHFGESGYKGKEQRAYNYGEGGIEGGYASKNNAFSSPKYLSPIKTNQSSLINKGDHGWAKSPPNFSSPSHAQRPSLAMDKQEHLMGQVDHGWANSNSKYSSPTHTQRSGLGMSKDAHLMGKVDNDWANSPTKFSSSNQARQSAHTMHNNEHGWAHSPDKFSNSTQAHHTNLGEMDRGWDDSPSNLYNPTQAHHSSRGMHKDEQMMGNMSRGWANSPTKYSGPNTFNSPNHTERAQHGWGHKSINGFGPNQANLSAHTSYDEYDQHVDDDVHDIMDEILTKYPAHNVGGGHENSWSAKPSHYAGSNKVAGYAKKAIGGLAQYGGAVQSMNRSSANFALNKEKSAGYSSNFGKEGYSASSNSNAKKYEASITLNRGRY